MSFLITVLLIATVIPSIAAHNDESVHVWNEQDIRILRSLWIGSLPPLPADPSNKYADNPKAIALGKRIFYDKRFSGNLNISCSTCHPPDGNFVDSLPQAHGMGATTRRSMPLIGVGYNSWFFWDGRADSLWAQALAPPESDVEHGITRTFCAHLITEHYRKEYEDIFGTLPEFSKKICPPIAKPDPENVAAYKAWMSIPLQKRKEITRVYVNMGKSIASYVRRISPGPSRFDHYVEAILNGNTDSLPSLLSSDEVGGLRLFIGKAKCINCHNGPLFTNGNFHSIDVPQPEGLSYDRGRADGINLVLSLGFNCLSEYSDAKPASCSELRFIVKTSEKYIGAFKTPTLRNVADRPPYMHAGQFSSLRQVLVFYQLWPDFVTGPPELEHVNLSNRELKQLEAFLRSLSGPLYIKDLQ